MNFEVTAVPAFRDNYIWVIADDDSGRCAVVDPGDAAPVIAHIENNKLQLSAILITHHHGDHVGGVAELTRFASVPVFGPATEFIPTVTHRLEDGDHVTLPDNLGHFKVLFVPGHTAGHIAYVDDNSLFCGDTLFGAGCGRLFEGTPAQMYRSLNKLSALPTSVSMYCAHEYTLSNLSFAAAVEPENGDIVARRDKCTQQRQVDAPTLPSTLAEERATNPFLRSDVPQVRASAETYVGHALSSPQEIFAALRKWKDEW